MSRRTARERGSAMVWAMLVLLAVGSVTSLLLQRSNTLAAAAAAERAHLAALHAAEAGVAHARAALADDPSYPGESLSVGACTVTVTVERVGNGWNVESAARPGSVRLTVDLAPAPGLPKITRWSAR